MVLGFSVTTEHTAASNGPYMHELYALDDEHDLQSKPDQHAYLQDDVKKTKNGDNGLVYSFKYDCLFLLPCYCMSPSSLVLY